MRSGQSSSEPSVWGLISDVHGNLPALETALNILADAGAQRLAFLGDYLGRGDSDGCVQRIRQMAEVAIVGNRDIDWHDRVSAESRTWVLGLPRVVLVGPLLLTHGDARLTPALGTTQIGRDFVRAFAEMERCEAQVWAFGHSHHARLWRKASADGITEQMVGDAAPISGGFRYFLNVGTTGLPFAGKGGPSVALVDFARGEVRHIPLDRQAPE
jgi:predicted phosphodiesterase